MVIAIVVISILAVAGLVWRLNKILPFKICPVCAGVAFTWLWLLGAKFLGYQIEIFIPAILMGGSVVGIAYQIEKKILSNKSPVLFKTFFISGGFIAVYGLLSLRYWIFLAATVFLVALAVLFLKSTDGKISGENKKIKELKKQMKNCC